MTRHVNINDAVFVFIANVIHYLCHLVNLRLIIQKKNTVVEREKSIILNLSNELCTLCMISVIYACSVRISFPVFDNFSSNARVFMRTLHVVFVKEIKTK